MSDLVTGLSIGGATAGFVGGLLTSIFWQMGGQPRPFSKYIVGPAIIGAGLLGGSGMVYEYLTAPTPTPVTAPVPK